jgi:hypothetical protein
MAILSIHDLLIDGALSSRDMCGGTETPSRLFTIMIHASGSCYTDSCAEYYMLHA